MKRVFFLILALFLFTGLVSCGDNGGSDDVGQDETIDIPAEQELEITPDLPTEDVVEVVPDPVEVVDVPPDPVDVPVEDVAIDWEPGEGLVGDACDGVEDCQGYPAASKECLTDIMGYVDFPGGYCSGSCTSEAECGEGATCVNIMIASYCLKTCTDPSDCRVAEGYTCGTIPIATGTYCVPPFGMPEGIDF